MHTIHTICNNKKKSNFPVIALTMSQIAFTSFTQLFYLLNALNAMACSDMDITSRSRARELLCYQRLSPLISGQQILKTELRWLFL